MRSLLKWLCIILFFFFFNISATAYKFSEVQSFMPQVSSDKGRIWFYRISSMVGAAGVPNIKLDDITIGKAEVGKFYFFDVEPGYHDVSTDYARILIKVSGGEAIFVRFHVDSGVGYILSMIDKNIAKDEISKLKFLEPDGAKEIRAYFKSKPKTGLIWVSSIEKANFYISEIEFGIIGAAYIINKNKKVIDRLNKILVLPILNKYYMQPFHKKLLSHGIQVIPGEPAKYSLITPTVLLGYVPKDSWRKGIVEDASSGSGSNFKEGKIKYKIPDHYNEYVRENNLEYLIIADLARFGRLRFSGTPPFSGGNNNLIHLFLYLVDAKTNLIVAQHNHFINQEPNQPIGDELRRALDNTYKYFFESPLIHR